MCFIIIICVLWCQKDPAALWLCLLCSFTTSPVCSRGESQLSTAHTTLKKLRLMTLGKGSAVVCFPCSRVVTIKNSLRYDCNYHDSYYYHDPIVMESSVKLFPFPGTFAHSAFKVVLGESVVLLLFVASVLSWTCISVCSLGFVFCHTGTR